MAHLDRETLIQYADIRTGATGLSRFWVVLLEGDSYQGVQGPALLDVTRFRDGGISVVSTTFITPEGINRAIGGSGS